METVFRAVLAARYDGTAEAAADCLATVQQITANAATWTIASQDAQRLVLRETQGSIVTDWPVRADRWLVVAPDFGIMARLTDEVYHRNYRSTPEVTELMVATPGFPRAVRAAVGNPQGPK